MRILISEWCCSGGLSGPDASRVFGVDDDPASLSREGRAMFRALIADAGRDGGFDVMGLVDESLPITLPDSAQRIVVPRGREIDSLVAAARQADAVIVVAPETAGVLASRVRMVREAGGTVLGPADALVALASDKQATIDALAASGVPVPAGRSLRAGEAWPEGFRLPAVRKARASAGCDGLLTVRWGDPLPCPAPGPTRIEAWHAGLSLGVSCLLGPGGVRPVATCRQQFVGMPPTYAGGSVVADVALRRRAETLAVRSLDALLRRSGTAPSCGWVGVDMILGDRSDGRDDRVLEVNPRITSSFVGIASTAATSLVREIVEASAGRTAMSLPQTFDFSFTITDADRDHDP